MNLGRILFAALLVLIGTPAAAHLTPNSTIELDFAADRVEATLTVPLAEMRYAGTTPDALVQRLSATSQTGARWAVKLSSAETITAPPEPDLVAHFILTPPDGKVRRFTLTYDGVISAVPSHIVLVSVRRDYAGGALLEEPALIGALRQGQTRLEIDRGRGSAWRGFLAAIGVGIHHIAIGYDHILFLLALLLPAPLIAAGARWGGVVSTRAMLGRLIWLVTAFTIGHSLTLIAGAYGGWALPVQPVEIGIALSVLVSAIHAWRPIFPGRERLVAGAFGLIHGLAFATIIGAFSLDPLHKAQAILGFNLGIELVQLGVVLLVAPILARYGGSPAYARFRVAAALFAATVALIWIGERSFGFDLIPA